MTHQIERIVWRDAHDLSATEWVLPDRLDELECLITSVGIVVGETDLFVVITHSTQQHDRHVRGMFAIPKSAIVERVLASTGAEIVDAG